MNKVILILMLLLAVIFTGCSAPEKQTVNSPIHEILPINETWLEIYGDGLDSRIMYNLAVIRYDQMAIFELMMGYHPVEESGESDE